MLRGQQRHDIRLYVSDWGYVTDKPEAQLALRDAFEQGAFMVNGVALASSISSFHGWDQLTALQNTRRQINELRERYFAEIAPISSADEYTEHMILWVEKITEVLEDIQALNLSLAHHLSEKRSSVLWQATTINGILIFLSMVLVGREALLIHKKKMKEKQIENTQLSQRKDELNAIKNNLFSLAEDLNIEKASALRYAKELEQSNFALQAKNKEMETFIFTVSHDLKAPLVTISGFTETLLIDLEDGLNEDQKYLFRRILDNVKHLDGLLSDLLDLSRVIKQDIEKEDLDVLDIVNKQCMLLETDINEVGAHVAVGQSMPRIWANDRLFAQCVQNLIANAIKYRSPERDPVISIECEVRGEETCFSVRDNGVGIAEKYQQRVFHVFERVGPGEGSGVGLAIVKSVMDKHGGRIELVSEQDTGSCFTLCFPVRKQNVSM